MQFYNWITGVEVSPQPWQEELQAGDFYVIDFPNLGVAKFEDAIGGRLEDYMQAPEGLSVYGQILNSDDCEAGFFNVRAYSGMCPDGEEGLMCIMEATRKISQEEFLSARRERWAS
jgi:hypothetical protein